MPTQLTGQFDLANATEGTTLPSNTDVASFTDANTSDTASAFTATIDWGDGTTTTGTVSGSNGSFIVQGGHDYTDEGFFQATATITRTADQSQIAPTGTVAVADADNLTGHGTTINYTPNQPLTNVTVATFTDTFTANTAGDFAVTIDWGDGTTTPGTVTGSNGSFSVSGSPTYTASGENTITVFIGDDTPDAAFTFVTSTAVNGFGGHVDLTSATEGQALTNATVASFADTTGNHPASDYTAAIDWGDGTTTPGTVSGSNGSFTVQGSHTYADEDSLQATVTITRTTDNTTIAPTGPVVIDDADFLTMSGTTIHGDPALNNVTVATFTDSNTSNVAGDFTATIDWGDGATTAGTVSGSNGSFSVSGSHTYAQGGDNAVTVTVHDDAPGVAQGTASSTAIVGLSGEVVLTSATEGTAVPGGTPVATFEDGNQADLASGFTATIDWGDGTTTAGVVSGSNGSFTVLATSNTYVDEANALMTVTITRTADNAQIAPTGNVTVDEADALTPHGTTISATAGQTFSGPVATFTDSFTGNVAGDFVATIDWGDGATTTGTVTGSNGSFTVNGSHTYAFGGQDTVHVTLTDDAPGTATATATTTATVAGPKIVFGGSGDYDTDADRNGDLLWQNGDGSVVNWDMNGAKLDSIKIGR